LEARRPRFPVTRRRSRRISTRGLTPNRGDNVTSWRRAAKVGAQAPPVTRMWRQRDIAEKADIVRKAGRSEYGSIRTAQFLWKRLFCQMNFRPVLIASPPVITALLIGLKGVLNPKVQVQSRHGVTL
jgi:hypothetical protein